MDDLSRSDGSKITVSLVGEYDLIRLNSPDPRRDGGALP
jgi:hypothetical protein